MIHWPITAAYVFDASWTTDDAGISITYGEVAWKNGGLGPYWAM